MTSTLSPSRAAVPTAGTRRRRRAAGVLGAVALAVLAWLAGSAAGADYVITDRTGTGVVTLDVAAVFAAGFALLGWGTLALLERLTRYARPAWTTLALAVLVLAEVPVVLVDATTTTAVALTVVHVAVAAVLIPVLRSAPGRATAG